jgi:hypothetical protein
MLKVAPPTYDEATRIDYRLREIIREIEPMIAPKKFGGAHDARRLAARMRHLRAIFPQTYMYVAIGMIAQAYYVDVTRNRPLDFARHVHYEILCLVPEIADCEFTRIRESEIFEMTG